ncbi:NTP transferase domain-containing protein [Polynucleobacter sp. AP-Latsch-80-C2]|uniref:nucleotidyltransferase family protein n=1 Tax=Polynucleobacter sp. AP-Latsch-80-C2 TaxID=2576931 RepID=UPI001C0DDDC2|nr:nucleotidyltransferase family protein [Polynucleobacter sp. AP-Latsch-80-C2]
MSTSRLTSESPNLRLAILLLAAGQGSRMGTFPKALIKKSGQSLLKRFCLAAQTLNPVQLLLVTGFHAPAIEGHLQSFINELNYPVKVLHNSQPDKGQGSSIRLGLESTTKNYDVLLVALSDQPEIGSAEIQALLEEYQNKDPDQEMILPMVDGQRGNPVLFSKKSIEAMLEIPGMVCRPYMDTHTEKVKQFITKNRAYLVDVDTEEDIQRQALAK